MHAQPESFPSSCKKTLQQSVSNRCYQWMPQHPVFVSFWITSALKHQLAGPKWVGLDRCFCIHLYWYQGNRYFKSQSLTYAKITQWTILAYHILRCWQRQAAFVCSKIAFQVTCFIVVVAGSCTGIAIHVVILCWLLLLKPFVTLINNFNFMESLF